MKHHLPQALHPACRRGKNRQHCVAVDTYHNRQPATEQDWMSYQCEDCSYSSTYFPQGTCPGCGSVRIRNRKSERQPVLKARKPYRLMLACALWLYLVVEIVRKLN